MTTIQVENFGEKLQVRCNLTEAASPVEVRYLGADDESWQGTQYQCADTRHMWGGLGNIGAKLLAKACEEEYIHEDASYEFSDVE